MKLPSLVATVAALTIAPASFGMIAYDNLGGAPYADFGYATFGLINGNVADRGMQFVAGQTISLTQLKVAIGQAYWDGTTLPGRAQIQLRADAANAPGAVIEQWTSSPQSSTAGGVETLTSLLNPTLTQGAKYWVTMNDAPGSQLGGAWYFADSPQPGNVTVSYTPAAGQPQQIVQLTRGYRTRVIGNLAGDATADDLVNADDYVRIDRGFAGHLTGFANGDFNNDGVINAADYQIIDTAYARSHPHDAATLLADRAAQFGDDYAASLATAIPEPAAAALLITPALLTRRPRRRRA